MIILPGESKLVLVWELEIFFIKMVFINFEKEDKFFFLIMNILIWRESLGKHALETRLYFVSQPGHIKML